MNFLYAIILIAGFAAFVIVITQSINELLQGDHEALDEPVSAQVRPLPAIGRSTERCA